MNKKYCNGCANDFYNGKNDIGVKSCFKLKYAKIKKMIVVGDWEKPPYKNKEKVSVPECYWSEHRVRYVDPKRISKDGYWL